MSVWLGGETVSRGVLRSSKSSAGDGAGLVVSVLGAGVALWVGHTSMVSVGVAVAILAIGALMCVPWDLLSDRTGGLSLRGWVGARVGYLWRAAQGTTTFNPSSDRLLPAAIGSLTSTDEVIGGQVIGVTEPAVSADLGRGRARYLFTIVECQGDRSSGARMDGTRWTALLEYLGSDVVPVSHVSQVASVTDWDPTDHVWLTQRDLERVESHDESLIGSYAEVIDQVASMAADRRTWVVLRFPVSAVLREKGSDEDSLRATAADYTAAVIERARRLGLRMRPLDARHHAALFRHLMDPAVSPDDTRGLGEGTDYWRGAFPAFTTSPDRRSLVVDGAMGRRWMSVWEVPAWTIEAGWLPTDFMYPAVTHLSGRLHRAFVVTCELVPTRRARARAREDVTSDAAAATSVKGVSDGTDELQLTGSQVRLEDLKRGRAVGVSWSMAVAFHSDGAKEHVDAARQMEGALGDCQIAAPARLRYRQDAALGLVMPLARGWRSTMFERMGLR